MDIKKLLKAVDDVYPHPTAHTNLTLQEGVLTLSTPVNYRWHSVILDDADLIRPDEELIAEVLSLLPSRADEGQSHVAGSG